MMASNATRWRRLANERPVAMVLLAGVLATHIATVFGFWFHGLGLTNLDFPRFNAYLLYRVSEGAIETATSTVQLVLGWTVHMFTGVMWAVIYAVVVVPMLKWRNNHMKALVWGLILATISALWWVPVLFPEFQLGFFAWNFDGFVGVLSIYIWHLIYAANLSLIYNPLSEDELASARV